MANRTSSPVGELDTVGIEARYSTAINRDLAHAMYSQSLRSMAMTVLVGLAFVWVFADLARTTVYVWFAFLSAVQLFNLYRRHQFRHLTQPREAIASWNPDPMLRAAIVVALINGAVFGSAGWLFWNLQYGNWIWFTVIIVCGTATASIHLYAYHPKAMLCFLFTLALPMAIRLSTYPEPGGSLGAISFVIYVAALVLFGLHQAQLIRSSMRMRYENTDLIARLDEQTRALTDANLAKSRFFAAASHDLRQPIHALSYYLSLLQPGDHDRPHVERIEQCIGSLDHLLEGVLDIARLDSGRVMAQRRAVDLTAHVKRLAGLYEGAAAAKGLTLRVHVPKIRVAGTTDEQLLERVLANLINNAIRYTHDGGVLLAIRARRNHWGIAVVDNGVGISPESLHRVFDEFMQLGNHERDASKGVGLGLATVKRICALLEHPLIANSKVQRGSWFEVRVPRADIDAVPVIAPVTTQAGDLQGRILLVEDNSLVSESLSKVLMSWGLTCDVAVNGEQALQLARIHHYDAALCDWRLPGAANGGETLSALAQLQPLLKLRVLVTGESDDSITDLPIDVPLLRKPIKPIRLRALLSAYLLPKTAKNNQESSTEH